ETHKFQLGPHIAENVVPSLTVTDSTPRNSSAGNWNSAPSKLRSSSSCFAKARNSHCPGQGFVAETLRDNVVNYVCRDRADLLWQYVGPSRNSAAVTSTWRETPRASSILMSPSKRI